MKKIAVLSIVSALCFADIIGKVTYVVDGDTIYFNSNGEKIKCRLLYIDTPESKNNKKARRDAKKCNVDVHSIKRAGQDSTYFVRELVRKGENYTIQTDSKDRYGRNLCVIKLKNSHFTLNELIVKRGYAVPFWRYMPNMKTSEKYSNLVNEANRKSVGNWANHNKIMQCMNK